MNTPSPEARTQLQSLVRGNNEVPNIYARNVSEGLYLGLQLLENKGEWHNSRSGRVIEYPGPVMTVYKRPEERVLFYKTRDANPFFHLFEALWMLGGRNDLAYVQQFNKRMAEFSDDGRTFNGAYGYRWRKYFRMDMANSSSDQLSFLIHHLKEEPNSRRAVLQMWSPYDLSGIVENPSMKDVPCNTQVYFKIRKDRLDMTVTCRSNDIIWGTYGANAVHFSILQDYVAAQLGVLIGTYYHLSESFHAYQKVYEKTIKIIAQTEAEDTLWYDSYIGWNKGMHYTPEPMFKYPKRVDEDLTVFLQNYTQPIFHNPFFTETAFPMLKAWRAYKEKKFKKAKKCLEPVTALDWKKAAIEWIERREAKWETS